METKLFRITYLLWLSGKKYKVTSEVKNVKNELEALTVLSDNLKSRPGYERHEIIDCHKVTMDFFDFFNLNHERPK